MAWLFSIAIFILLAALAGAYYYRNARRAEPYLPEEYGDDEYEEYEDEEDAPLPAAARKESVAALEAAEKRESTEHGRIILEWLRKLKLMDVSVEEAISTGNPDERAAIKQTFQDVLDHFNDFRGRLLSKNPQAGQMQSFLQAERIAQVFQHAVGLLAKLEIANSLADTMQISSGSSMAMKEQSEKASDLLARLQKAMEDTVTACEMAQAENDRQQQEQQDRAAADQQAQQGKRRRRRRRQHGGVNMATAKGAAKRVRAGDINGDGVADSLQGLSRTKNPIRLENSPFEGVDMQQLRELGKTLAQSTNSAQGMDAVKIAIAEVRANDKLVPDDLQLSEQEKLRREKQGPGGPNMM